ncbi:dipeptidase [Rhodalgimonas zhirmunskyi]|uniref:Membrane dipeptidase n=1 Tax=Rhodalgimonas zhirmunskyi TaxID=2964767 RepID=A0AAJ1U5J2_9RHOB|nr:membrane dipeptidase [Rhodoalgimonas zhirmunskyi]MDQ2093530.1 membrane dipeptidase [Rhodoalgimonas zhirmunskyi]
MRRWVRRIFWILVIVGLIGLAAFWTFAPSVVERMRNKVAAHAPYPVSDSARALHERLVVGDWHADSLLWKRDLLVRGDRGQVDLPRLLEGGVAVQVFTAVTKSPMGQNYDQNSAEAFDNITLLAFGQLWPVRTWTSIYERAIYQAQKLEGFEAASEGRLKIIRTEADLDDVLARRAAGEAVVGGILGVEGLHPLEGDLANLNGLYNAGHRVFGLQHFFDNALGGSLHGEGDHGLTEFGRRVVEDLQKKPVIIDVAHSSPQVVRDVLAMTDVPIVLSHSGIHSACPVKRNIPDDLMRGIAASGGVIGMGYWAEVACGKIDPDGIAAMIKAGIAAVGEDHISLGSDFDGSVATAFDTSELPALTDALLRAGVSEAQIAKVMGGNMMRVLRARLD